MKIRIKKAGQNGRLAQEYIVMNALYGWGSLTHLELLKKSRLFGHVVLHPTRIITRLIEYGVKIDRTWTEKDGIRFKRYQLDGKYKIKFYKNGDMLYKVKD